MLVDLPPGSRAVLRLLFAGFRPLHGTWEAALATEFGEALTDDAVLRRSAGRRRARKTERRAVATEPAASADRWSAPNRRPPLAQER